MKSIIGVILTLLIVSAAYSQEVEFFEGSWDEANKKAAVQNKYIFVDAYTEWCGWCKVMDEEMFSDSNIALLMNTHYVPVKIDFEDSLGILLAMKFRVSGYPTSLVFNPEGQLVDRFVGYSPDHDKYFKFLQDALNVKEERIFAYDSRQLEIDWPEFYKNAFTKGKKKWPGDSLVNAYLDNQNDLFSEINWSVISKFRPTGYQDYFIEHYDRYSILYGIQETEDLLNGLIFEKLREVVKKEDKQMLEDVLSLCVKFEDPEQSRLAYQSYYYEKTKNWKGYCGILGDYIKENGFNDHMYINNACWSLYENADDKETLEKATGWMEIVTKEHPTWMYLDTYAALLFKSGNLELAEKVAKEAIEKGTSDGETGVEETEKLLADIRAAIVDLNE